MKKVILSTLVLLIPALLMAHAPKSIKASLSKDSKKVKIEVTHPVKNVEEHHVEYISVMVNGKEVKKIDFKKQSLAEKETVEIEIPGVAKGTEITVTAKCNKLGSKKEVIKL